MTNKEQPNNEWTYQADQLTGQAWINGPHNCLGRFTRNGWEIYQDMGRPVEVVGTTNTLMVRVKPTNEREWNDFKMLMKEHHNVDISEEEYPNG